MNYKKQKLILLKLYKLIPPMECKPRCHDCCGPVPMTEMEHRKMGKKLISGINCPYLGENGCVNYENRPFICRLFGTIKNPIKYSPETRLICLHGHLPKIPISGLFANQIAEKYFELKPFVLFDK